MKQFLAYWQHLTAPHPTLSSPEERQARFLAGILLFFLGGGLLLQIAGLAIITSGGEASLVASDLMLARNELLWGIVITAALFTPLYALSRTRYYQLAAILSSYALNALILIVALFGPLEPLLLATLVVPLILASAILSLRATTVLASATLFVLVVATMAADEPWLLLRPLTFYGITAGLVLLSAYQRRRVHAEHEAVLRESESRFRALSEKALVGVYIIQDGLFRYVNPAMGNIFGYEPDELVNKLGPLDVTMSEDREKVRNHIRARLNGETNSAHYVLRGQRKDGSEVICEVLGRIMEYHGEPALIGMLMDITERKKMEQAEEEQRALSEALRDIAAVLNSTLDFDQVLERILENVGRVVPHDGANIMLIEGETTRVVRCQGQYTTLGIAEDVMNLGFNLKSAANFRTMAHTRKPYVIEDTEADPDWIHVPETRWIRSYVGAPIYHEGELIGFLNLDSMEPGFFTVAHAERLLAFADQVAIAVKNARLYQELENYSEVLEEAVATRTVELRRTTEQVEVILNNSPDAVILLRTDGSVQMANPAFYEMFGYEEHEVLERPLPPLVSPMSEEPFFRALDSVLRRGKRSRLELPAQRKDGTTFDADLALAPVIDDGVVRGGVCSLHDISRLKEVDRMKDAFVSNVSHELRTPITSLRLYHDLLRRNPDKSAVYLQRQEREIGRLNTIIEDLLRLSRLDRGQIDVTLEPTSLNDLIAEYVLDRLPLVTEKGLNLEWEPSIQPLVVNADRGLLEQVVGILLTNALNYTASQSTVTVTTALVQRDGMPWATCAVCDNSPGIDPEELPYLFDRFFRGAAARQAGTPGTGLGLAIAHEIMEQHGGFIEVRNKDNGERGAIFTLWIPVVIENTERV